MTVTIVRKCPINPAETLASRRQPEEIRGDAITFPLREDTTNPEIVRALRTAQAAILREMPELQWNSKAERHAKKHFKIQKNLHLSFASTLPPSRMTDYLEARINAGGKQKEMKALLDSVVTRNKL